MQTKELTDVENNVPAEIVQTVLTYEGKPMPKEFLLLVWMHQIHYTGRAVLNDQTFLPYIVRCHGNLVSGKKPAASWKGKVDELHRNERLYLPLSQV